MPQQFWKHRCPGHSPHWLGSPRACACGEPMVYDGWHKGRFESMAWFQKFRGLKPIGPHRALERRLFANAENTCEDCAGHGYFDAPEGPGFVVCTRCDGAGYYSIISTEERARLRAQVLAEFPDAAAPSNLPHPAFGLSNCDPLEIGTLIRESPATTYRAVRARCGFAHSRAHPGRLQTAVAIASL